MKLHYLFEKVGPKKRLLVALAISLASCTTPAPRPTPQEPSLAPPHSGAGNVVPNDTPYVTSGGLGNDDILRIGPQFVADLLSIPEIANVVSREGSCRVAIGNFENLSNFKSIDEEILADDMFVYLYDACRKHSDKKVTIIKRRRDGVSSLDHGNTAEIERQQSGEVDSTGRPKKRFGYDFKLDCTIRSNVDVGPGGTRDDLVMVYMELVALTDEIVWNKPYKIRHKVAGTGGAYP